MKEENDWYTMRADEEAEWNKKRNISKEDKDEIRQEKNMEWDKLREDSEKR
ncbi:hypothetical protein BDC45DRAFT_565431 [Circinella umbellata]|nr:hypothetical protein BDC45DRAFT_565431 [Circinella umbellata]